MMKRVLSIAVVLCMLCAFIPASVAFAAAETDNITVWYGARLDNTFSGTDYYKDVVDGTFIGEGIQDVFSSGTPVVDYTMTNGLWRSYSRYARYDSAYIHKTYGWFVFQPYASDANNYYAFAFNVPKTGYYDLTVNLADECPGNDSYGRCYVSYMLFDSGVTDAEIRSAVVDSDKRLGTLCTISGDDKSLTDTATNVYLTAGEHVIAFNAHDGSTTYNSYVLNYFKISQNGGTDNAPFGGTTGIDETDLTTGGTAQAFVEGTLYGSSDWNSYVATETTFRSSNDAVATVDASGNVTAKGTGSADIYAVVDGYELAPVTVNVTAASGVAIIYGVTNYNGSVGSSDYYTEVITANGFNSGLKYLFESAGTTPYIDYTMTNGLWYTYSKYDRYGNSYARSSGFTFDTYAESTAYYALAFNVPKTGYYDLTVKATNNCPGVGSRCRFTYSLFDSGVTDATIKETVSKISWNDSTGLSGTKGTDYLGVLCNIESAADYSLESTANVYLTAGEHVIVFHPATTTGSNYLSYEIDYFKLSQGNGALNAPFGGKTGIDKTDLTAGGTAQAFVEGKLYGSLDWNSYVATETTFRSSDDAVATVDASGNVTAKGMGTADIYAVVDGYELAPVTVNVTALPGPTIMYGVKPDNTFVSSDYYNEVLNGKLVGTSLQNLFDLGTPLVGYERTNGLWRAYSQYYKYDASYIDQTYGWLVFQPHSSDGDDGYYALAFNVPEDGLYDLTVKLADECPGATDRCYVSYMVLDGGVTADEINSAVADPSKRLGTLCSVNNEDKKLTETVSVNLTAGEHVIVFNAHNGTGTNDCFVLSYFKLSKDSGALNAPFGGKIAIDETNLTAGGAAKVSFDGKLYGSLDWNSYVATETTFRSSNDAVATVDASGNVTAKGAGTADIYAVVDGYKLASVTVNVPVTKFLGIGIPSGCIINAKGNNEIEDIAVGTEITLIKPDHENFKYFRIGGIKNGKAIRDNTYTFTLVSPTCVTAVYDNEDDVKLELWGPNNTIIDVLTPPSGETSFTADLSGYTPRFAGYTFNGWKFADGSSYNGGTVDNVKRVVADFTADADQSVSGITVNGNETAATNNTAVTVPGTSSAAIFRRDGTIVYRGESYSHYPWTATSITVDNSGSEETISPKVLLTRHASRGTEFMLEYNTFGTAFVEAGIVFGATADVELGAYYQKASTAKTDAHGQMTARSSGDATTAYARGYLVYNDGKNIKVVYTDAQQIAAE